MRILLFSAVLTAALLPSLAFGGEGVEHTGIDGGALVRHAINLAVLLGLLWTFLKRPVNDFLLFRRSEVQEQLESSARLKASAETSYAEVQARLASFEKEVEAIMAAVSSEAESEQKRLLALSEKAAEQIVAAAHATVGEELRRARVTLQTETVDLAVGLAREALIEAIGDADQGRLNGAYLQQVEGSVAR